MELLTPGLRAALLANEAASRAAGAHDPVPVVRLFDPLGRAIWLANTLDPEDGDTLFGLADLGFGCPELGSFSLAEIAALRLPFGLGIERDLLFASTTPLSVWAETARRAGSIAHAEQVIRAVEAHDVHAPLPDPDPLPPRPTRAADARRVPPHLPVGSLPDRRSPRSASS